MADEKIIYVYKDWDTIKPEKMGTICVDGGKGREVISFEMSIIFLEFSMKLEWGD